jgi:hypothetical protein
VNRHNRRALKREQHAFVGELPAVLAPIPPSEFPPVEPLPIKAWRSRKYLVQLYEEQNVYFPGMLRLSVCRARKKTDGGWEDGLTWDELHAIKREVGFGDWYGIEIYPAEKQVINVANFRHLWLLPTPLPIGWMQKAMKP